MGVGSFELGVRSSLDIHGIHKPINHCESGVGSFELGVRSSLDIHGVHKPINHCELGVGSFELGVVWTYLESISL